LAHRENFQRFAGKVTDLSDTPRVKRGLNVYEDDEEEEDDDLFDDDEEDDDDEDDDLFDDDEEDDDDEDDEAERFYYEHDFVAIRFPQNGGIFSEKRYLYTIPTGEDEPEVGNWVVVKVGNKEKCVLVVATDDESAKGEKALTEAEVRRVYREKGIKNIVRYSLQDELSDTFSTYNIPSNLKKSAMI